MASHFMRAFDIIDKDHSGELDVSELRQFMIENNYERQFVQVSELEDGGSRSMRAFRCKSMTSGKTVLWASLQIGWSC